MQTALRRVIKGIGGFDHAEWRAFRSERTKADARGFIDGDLIEQVCQSTHRGMSAYSVRIGTAVPVDQAWLSVS